MHAWSFGPILLLIGTALPLTVQGQEAKVIEKEGRVVVTKAGRQPSPAQIGMGLVARDRLGTGDASRAVLKMSEKWSARIDEQTDIEITPAAFRAKDKEALKLALGGAFIYSREAEGEVKVETPYANGALRGTQLMVRVGREGKTWMQVMEGEVTLENEFGQLLLKRGEAGEAELGRPPRRTAVIDARNLLQWSLYYPAILDPDELGLSPAEQRSMEASIKDYRQGDLLNALERYPNDFNLESDGTKLYRAAVLLATGRVDSAREAMRPVRAEHPGRRALERLLAAVGQVELPDATAPVTGSEALADSYYLQSRRNLYAALHAAMRATELSPGSGFAWTRLAELEFSFGRTREAARALKQGLKLTPRNAQAHALRGYLLSAENRITHAREAFETAVQLDGGLGNAWLGLGLTKIKQGELAAGRADLQTAATVEPTRSFFFSYHGKALSAEGHARLARKDLDLAKQLDPNDPTPWLYSAIQYQQEGRYNLAIDEMHESVRMNDNRRVFRSQFLLDQDSAVRSANLAKIYENNGMPDLAVREASRAVEHDYANAAAHLFLANSFDALRDPNRVSLRFETAWFNEQLLAFLLSPVGGGPLSQFISQQEYSKLLAADGFAGNSITEWREHGVFSQELSLVLNRGSWNAGLDLAYYRDEGERANTDSTRRELYAQFKYQVSPYDTVYALAKAQIQATGDLLRNPSNLPGAPGLRFKERQRPGLLLLGANHVWGPGVHTLFLGGRLAANQSLVAPGSLQTLLERDPGFLQPGFLRPGTNGALEFADARLRNATTPPVGLSPSGSLGMSPEFQAAIAPFLGVGPVTGVFGEKFDVSTQRDFRIWSAEVQHIWQARRHTLLVGGRAQSGEFDTRANLDLLNSELAPLTPSPAARQHVNVDFTRRSLYAYDFVQVMPTLTLVAGASWDGMSRPENFRNPPVGQRQIRHDRTNAKLGLTFSPARWVNVRAAYAEALGGVTFDESIRLEPVQFAGFNQAFRTVIAESIAGSVEAPVYKNRGMIIDGALPTRTWWSVSYEALTEKVRRTVGAFDVLAAPVFPYGVAILPASTAERLDYREDVFAAGLNQLIGTEIAIGGNYRRTRAELRQVFSQVPVALAAGADGTTEGLLHVLTLNVNWNLASGWFARVEADSYWQQTRRSFGGQRVPSEPDQDFWLSHAHLGFRFHRNSRDVSVGMLNLADRDYKLNTLTYTHELPHRRTLVLRCRLGF